ncbi:two pore domain potassium channel family protein [Nocardioides sp. MAH-18]|uniref:Two pore domain potassium channel family protein n=1 Tax=Nocardioides agri TaxID=2682843 RepID=A0A6L6XWT9_9ACTN|nr:potassium channel family protein [Nocardioides sp. CGMCC 1.13656]MVQ51689.1 two pore domain potassium channel family protein [Nocardioides sp. MAH-18]
MTLGHRLHAARSHPSAVLLAAQLAVVLLYPFVDDAAWGRAMIGVFQLLVVAAALMAVRRTSALTRVAVFFGVPAVLLTFAEAAQPDSDTIVLLSSLFHAPFYFYVSYAMIRYVFHDDRVTRDELYATGAAFTVVAWGFAYVYAACQALWPGSFIGATSEASRSWFELLYLSFSTMTSVGLSDVVPVAGHARSFVMVEMVAGVFYVALVVARLVSLAVVRTKN